MVKLGMEGTVEAKIAKHQGMDELMQNDEKTMDSWEPEGIGEHDILEIKNPKLRENNKQRQNQT